MGFCVVTLLFYVLDVLCIVTAVCLLIVVAVLGAIFLLAPVLIGPGCRIQNSASVVRNDVL